MLLRRAANPSSCVKFVSQIEANAGNICNTTVLIRDKDLQYGSYGIRVL